MKEINIILLKTHCVTSYKSHTLDDIKSRKEMVFNTKPYMDTLLNRIIIYCMEHFDQ